MAYLDKQVKNSILLIVISFIITTFESSMIMPMGPIIALQYGVSIEMITYLNIGFNLAGLLTPILGVFSDKYSAKKALIAGMILFSFGCFIVSINHVVTYVIGRFTLGIGYYSLLTLRFSYTSKIVDKSILGNVSSIYKIAFAIGAFLSPYGSQILLEKFSFQFIYFLLAILALTLAFAMKQLIDVPSNNGNIINLKTIFQIIKNKNAQFAFMANVLISMPTILFYTYASIYMTNIGKSYDQITLYYTIAAIGSIFGGFLISYGCRKFGINRLCVYSSIICGLILFGIAIEPTLLILAFAFGLFFDLLWGIFYPSCSTYFMHQSAIFLSLLGTVNAMANIGNAFCAPKLYAIFGFKNIIFICAILMIIAGILIKRSQKGIKI